MGTAKKLFSVEKLGFFTKSFSLSLSLSIYLSVLLIKDLKIFFMTVTRPIEK